MLPEQNDLILSPIFDYDWSRLSIQSIMFLKQIDEVNLIILDLFFNLSLELNLKITRDEKVNHFIPVYPDAV